MLLQHASPPAPLQLLDEGGEGGYQEEGQQQQLDADDGQLEASTFQPDWMVSDQQQQRQQDMGVDDDGHPYQQQQEQQLPPQEDGGMADAFMPLESPAVRGGQHNNRSGRVGDEAAAAAAAATAVLRAADEEDSGEAAAPMQLDGREQRPGTSAHHANMNGHVVVQQQTAAAAAAAAGAGIAEADAPFDAAAAARIEAQLQQQQDQELLSLAAGLTDLLTPAAGDEAGGDDGLALMSDGVATASVGAVAADGASGAAVSNAQQQQQQQQQQPRRHEEQQLDVVGQFLSGSEAAGADGDSMDSWRHQPTRVSSVVDLGPLNGCHQQQQQPPAQVAAAQVLRSSTRPLRATQQLSAGPESQAGGVDDSEAGSSSPRGVLLSAPPAAGPPQLADFGLAFEAPPVPQEDGAVRLVPSSSTREQQAAAAQGFLEV